MKFIQGSKCFSFKLSVCTQYNRKRVKIATTLSRWLVHYVLCSRMCLCNDHAHDSPSVVFCCKWVLVNLYFLGYFTGNGAIKMIAPLPWKHPPKIEDKGISPVHLQYSHKTEQHITCTYPIRHIVFSISLTQRIIWGRCPTNSFHHRLLSPD